ncbi:hypothetical protein ACPTI4_31180, partial [Pseudomonas aeruginosa]
TATDLGKTARVGDGSLTRLPVHVLGSLVAAPVEVAEAIFLGAGGGRGRLVESHLKRRGGRVGAVFTRFLLKKTYSAHQIC